NSKIIAWLWHQGEYDAGDDNFKIRLDEMLSNLDKEDLINTSNFNFIAGGMVPFWVSKNSSRHNTQMILKDLPNRIPKTGYADPEYPFVIKKIDDTIDTVHYDGEGMRELSTRYFSEYLRLNP